MRLLIVILVILLIALQSMLWLGDNGIPKIKQMRTQVSDQQQQNAELRARNAALEAEVNDLRTGLEATEERARTELGLIKQDETFYQVAPPSTLRDTRNDDPENEDSEDNSAGNGDPE